MSERFHLETAEWVGVGDDIATLDDWGNDWSASVAGKLTVLGECELAVEVLVDDTSHAILAVEASRLGAVVPDGLLVLDNDLEDIGSLALLGWLEAGEEGVGILGLAWLAETRLSDGVV
jgi:hypothetical protein